MRHRAPGCSGQLGEELQHGRQFGERKGEQVHLGDPILFLESDRKISNQVLRLVQTIKFLLSYHEVGRRT